MSRLLVLRITPEPRGGHWYHVSLDTKLPHGSPRVEATVDAGEPGDIAVVRATFANPQGGVWAAFPDEGRLLRGEALAGAGLASVRWHDVPLPAGARPVALMAYDHDQVLALDAGNDQVLVFSGGGRQVVRWPVAGQNLEKGDLTTDSAYRRFVHVVDGTGRLFVFEP